ncbi:hypothetical protein B0H13DRAFT_2480158 [Mycena leptocephala]|nr:hypothetical protein B0H13DRAFT_2480158 [Mycena leptocephala]
MSYNPESTTARPLLALTTTSSLPSSNYGPRRRQRRARLLLLAACGTLVLFIGSAYLYFSPSTGLPIPDRLAPYYAHPIPPPSPARALHGQDVPPAPRGFGAFFAFAQERGCLVDGCAGVWCDFAPFWRVENAVAAQRVGQSGGRLEGIEKGGRGWFREMVEAVEKRLVSDNATHGIAAPVIRDGRAHKPEHLPPYFVGDWEGTVNKSRLLCAFPLYSIRFGFNRDSDSHLYLRLHDILLPAPSNAGPLVFVSTLCFLWSSPWSFHPTAYRLLPS